MSMPRIILIGFLSGLVGLSLLSCKGKVNTPEVRDAATEAVRLLVEKPESVKIVGYSRLDSVFGRNFIKDGEKEAVAQLLMGNNKAIIGDAKSFDDIDFSDPAKSALMERQMAATEYLRQYLFSDDNGGEFSGYRMKVQFEAVDSNNIPYRSEYWFIFDKQGKIILHSFEIPLS